MRCWLWPLGALLVAVVGALTLESLWLGAYGPDAADPHGRHVAEGQAWLATYGFASVIAGLGTTWSLLRRANLLLAGLTVAFVAVPVTFSGTFSLYFWAACLGLV